MMLENYNDTDVEFLRTFKLEGAEFKADSGRLYNELKPLVIDNPIWTYVKPFGHKWAGREAVLALEKYAEGSAAIK